MVKADIERLRLLGFTFHRAGEGHGMNQPVETEVRLDGDNVQILRKGALFLEFVGACGEFGIVHYYPLASEALARAGYNVNNKEFLDLCCMPGEA